MMYTRDLKSLAFRGVPVQVWLRAPLKTIKNQKDSRTKRLFFISKIHT
nr:MAG TPA: hypothetical protein [Caudoviricetes sp.]